MPLWREHNVVRKMIEHNLAAHGYERCDFFVGVYPGLDSARLDHMAAVFERFLGGERVTGGVA